MSSWEWWQVAITAVASIVTLIGSMAVFKVGISFDLTKWLENRRKAQHDRLITLCPHAVMEKDEQGKVVVRMLTIKPPGTLQAICRRCGRVFIGGMDEVNDLMKRWAKNPKLFREQEDKFLKQCKRMKLL